LGPLLSDAAAKAAIYRRQSEIYEWQLRRPREALLAIERALAGAPAVADDGFAVPSPQA